jgi:hypothetical protein
MANYALSPIASFYLDSIWLKSQRVRPIETLAQSVRYSIQLIDRDPFERPLPPLRRMSAERSAFDV